MAIQGAKYQERTLLYEIPWIEKSVRIANTYHMSDTLLSSLDAFTHSILTAITVSRYHYSSQ